MTTSPTCSRIATCAAVLFAFAATSCAVFLPRRPNSQIVDGEKVTLELWTEEQYNAHRAQFSLPQLPTPVALPEPEQVEAAPLVAAAAAAAVGLAVDYTKKKLEEEATRYEAQFGKRIAFDDFWVTRSGEVFQNYVALRLTRTTTEYSSTRPAFDLICAFRPSTDRRVFQVFPVHFVTNATKAKVLERNPVAFWTYFMASEEVDVLVDIEVDSIWIDKAQVVHIDKIGAFQLSQTGYALSSSPSLGATDLQGQSFGWFPGIPRSFKIDGTKPIGSGTFWVRALVTERDTSQAKQYLEQAATAVGEHKEDVVKLVQEE